MVDGPEHGAATVTPTDPVSPAQTRATFAYARTLLDSEVADAAAEDALAAFRQALAAQPARESDPQSAAANETLLALTRLMSAVSVPDRSSPADRRQAVWASIGHASHCTCRESAALLATRANGNIQPREDTALDEHLATCGDCRALSVRAADAEQAFRRELIPPRGPSGFGVASVPRAAYGGLGVLVAVIVAGVLLLSGSSHSNSGATLAPVQTNASAQLKAPAVTQSRPPASRSVHHPSVTKRRTTKPGVKRHAVHPRTATASTTTTPAATATTPAGSTPAASQTGATGNTGAAATSGAGASSTPADSPPSAASSGDTASSGSTASVVSGSGSLPADSAPQQGIGSPTTSTTP